MACWMERQPPTISSTSLRSPRMTSGLFNTGFAGDSAEITSGTTAVQPANAKTLGQDFVEIFDHDLPLNMFEGLGDLGDPLGDASMDSFMDLTAFLGENAFLGQDGLTEPQDQADLQPEVKANKKSLKRPFSKVDAKVQRALTITKVVEVEPLIPTTVMEKSPNYDHDYVAKRPRMSTLMEDLPIEVSLKDEEDAACLSMEFLYPGPIPTPSTSQITDDSAPTEDKYRHRREKNNIASKRSRESRKMKFENMEQEAERLEEDNKRLEVRIVELEKLAKQMKEILVAKMAGKA